MGKRIYLTEEQFKGYIKHLLNESFSDHIFHFTSIKNLEYIIKNNAFVLSSIYFNSTDFNIGEGYPFYMSFTRQFSNKFGYSQYKNTQKINLLNQLRVRIEVDGQALSSRYVGKPVNYHGYTVANNKQQANANNDPLKLIEIRQSEDRLFSKSPKIENVDRFIRRIDILYDFTLRKNTEVANILMRILRDPKYKDKVFIYKDEKDFNYFHSNNFINQNIINAFNSSEEFSRRFTDSDIVNDEFLKNNQLGKGNGRFKQTVLTTVQCRVIGRFILLIAYLLKTNDYISLINTILDGYDVGDTFRNLINKKILTEISRYNDVHNKNYLNLLYNDIRHVGTNFRKDTRIIFGNINKYLYISITKLEKALNAQKLTLRDIINLLKKQKI